MYELLIYTFSHWKYASQWLMYLTLKESTLVKKVISLHDGIERHLDIVLAQENAILILDHSKKVSTTSLMC